MAPLVCHSALYVLFMLQITFGTFAQLNMKMETKSLFTYDPCGASYIEDHCLEIKCKRKHVIFDLDVIARSGECPGRTKGLIVDTLNCFWTSSCKIKFPMQKMLIGLFTDGISPGDCVYEEPTKISVQEIKCAPKQEVFDICSGKRLAKRGIIRSHDEFPWDYPRPENASSTCSLMYNLSWQRTLYVTVLHLDLAESDRLTINGKGVTAKDDRFNDTSVVFNFIKRQQKQADYKESGHGFVLCFKEGPSGRDAFDVCEDIAKKSRRTIRQVGPKTKRCLLTIEGQKKKKRKKKLKNACCCDKSTCEADIKVAEKFHTTLSRMIPNWKNCKGNFPCECNDPDPIS